MSKRPSDPGTELRSVQGISERSIHGTPRFVCGGVNYQSATEKEPIVSQEKSTENLAKEIEQHPDFQVLRRLAPVHQYREEDGSRLFRAAFLDVETTGLNHLGHEVIEIGLVQFTYAEDGRIFSVPDTGMYNALNQPEQALPLEITKLTGITTEMLSGQAIDATALQEKVQDCNLIIAHNAAFDRKFVERKWKFFQDKPWACTMHGIDWTSEGMTASKLDYLGTQYGFFFDGHRAIEDCQAGIEILSRILPTTGELVMGQLLRNARLPTYRIYAAGAAFDFREILKRRGYAWNPGDNGKPKAWWIDVSEGEIDEEKNWLATEVALPAERLPVDKIDAFNRYSDRV